MSHAVGSALYQKALQLIVLPTEKCNFRCTYCYEDFEIGKMKRPTVDAIKKLIQARIERGTLDVLLFSWFGGEPLLAEEIVLELGAFGNELYKTGQLKTYSGDTTTNGYLLKEGLLERLVAQRQTSFQISLDGFGKGHDQTRRYASGKGTFDVIWANLLAAKRSTLDFRITLRCHMTRENGASTEELVRHICDEFHEDKRFNVFFKPIENLGGPNAKGIKSVEKESARDRVVKLTDLLKEARLDSSACIEGPESNTGAAKYVGPGTELRATEERHAASEQHQSHVPQHPLANFNGYICYAAKPNSLMIRADGTIGKCTVLMNDPRNKVGQLNDDGTVTIDSQLVSNVWMRGFVSHDAKELGCPAQNLPKLQKEAPLVMHVPTTTRQPEAAV